MIARCSVRTIEKRMSFRASALKWRGNPLLRCPAQPAPAKASLPAADRSHLLPSLPPPPAAVGSLPLFSKDKFLATAKIFLSSEGIATKVDIGHWFAMTSFFDCASVR